MIRRVLLGAAMLSAAVACTDSVTNPALEVPATALAYSAPAPGDAPPPPMDSTMAAYDEGSSSPLFTIRVTYFYNPEHNNAWMTFEGGNARVQATRTKTTAKGSITLAVGGGVWTADLARDLSAESLKSFGTCKWDCSDLDINGTLTSEGSATRLRVTLSFAPPDRGDGGHDGDGEVVIKTDG